MNDPSNRHLTEVDVAVYLDDRNSSPKHVIDHINSCPECADLVASVLECAAYEDAVETVPLTATQIKEKLTLVKKQLEGNAADEQRDVPATGDSKKPKSQRGDWGSFFTGLLGGQNVGDLFDSGANTPLPALGDKRESPEDSEQESIDSAEDSHDSGTEPEDFLDAPLTNDGNETSIDLDVDDSGMEELQDDNDHLNFDDADLDDDGIEDDSPLDW